MHHILLVIFTFILTACSNVNSKAIEYREVHVEPHKNPFMLGDHAANVDVTPSEKIIPIKNKRKFDFFYDKVVS